MNLAACIALAGCRHAGLSPVADVDKAACLAAFVVLIIALHSLFLYHFVQKYQADIQWNKITAMMNRSVTALNGRP